MSAAVNEFGRVVCEIDLEPQQLDYVKAMMARYGIPDVGKAVRVLVNHAQATPELEEQIYKKSSPTWTPTSARRCASRSAVCTTRCGSPASTSPTTRRRPW